MSFLIIDDFGEFRRSVKTMCQQLGAVDIDQAANGEEAVRSCKAKRYDVILSDYNLGEGKDGQQILEEAVHRRYLKPGAIFVMITAENSTAMVMGALEYQPDAYLTKPFNKITLKGRLDKLLEKKIALKEIDQARDAGKHALVLRLCDEQIAANTRYALTCMRTKAELLEERGALTSAHEIYMSLAKERPLPWALAGAARTLIQQGNPRAARALLESVVKSLPNFVDAQDLLAQALVCIGEHKEAQQILMEAIKRSPKAVQRQQKLGDVALINQDIPVATRAFKQAVVQGRHSVFKQSDSYIKLAHCLTRNLGGSPVDDKRTTEEIQRVLHEVENDYKGDKQVAIRSLLAQADLKKTLKHSEEAETALQGAANLLKNLDQQIPANVAIDVAEKFTHLGDTSSAKAVLHSALKAHGDDPEFQSKYQQILGEALKQDEAREQAIALNNSGTEAFQNGQHETALKQFRLAVKLAPQNISIVLNTAQTLLDIYQTHLEEHDLIEECIRYLIALQNISPEDKRYERYQALVRQTHDLKKEVKT